MNRATVVVSVLAAAAVGYAAYFDYSRRHLPEFRRLLRQRRRAAAKQQDEAKKASGRAKLAEVRAAVEALLAALPLPTDLRAKELYFMEQVLEAERLAVVPGQEVAAAVAFYKALCVYPKPSDLLSIYQKLVPENVYDLVILAIATRPPQSLANILGDSIQGSEADVSEAVDEMD